MLEPCRMQPSAGCDDEDEVQKCLNRFEPIRYVQHLRRRFEVRKQLQPWKSALR
jgi:hypothetical protein